MTAPLLPPTFIVCIGLPGSGKTTKALEWVAAGRYRLRLNRDGGRTWLYGRDRYNADGEPLETLPEDEEAILRSAYLGALQAALLRGWSVIDDNTNLYPDRTTQLMDRACSCGATAEVWDFTDVPVETCIARDAQRPEPVGRAVIEMLAEQARRTGVLAA
jgi:tRNA uridine 5-carbamoylmethylation protein Kti12